MMTSNEIREKFLSYFESKGHTRVQSSSLVPHNDPTLLFTNAGMNQFKDVFLGVNSLPYKRATTSQKCVRAGGKHNDLDSVGRTARHHTFFEMLGNFSFGDYFKKEAIEYAWEFLTGVLGLPPERLWVSVYRDDNEAFELWHEVAHVPKDRIVRLGERDNFWSMGDTGPCGPCSEIYIDLGEDHKCNAEKCALGECDCDRWRELWNLVFMQYDRDENGKLSPLPRPSIDTGMGLERMATVMQKVYSNYDTDLLRPIISFVEKMAGQDYYGDDRGFPFRVISDHSRAITFLISDGVLPGNEGRSYVLRRILRRAARYGKELGFTEPFLFKIVPEVSKLMNAQYPEIAKNLDYIQKVVRVEEQRFLETLNDGLKILSEAIEKLQSDNAHVIPGDMAFMLYDTYGFPLDLTQDVAQERDFTVDMKTFETLMNKQKERAKASKKGTYTVDDLCDMLDTLNSTRFVGYESHIAESKVEKIIVGNSFADFVDKSVKDSVIVTKETPFYGESGGQIGDTGVIEGEGFLFIVEDTHKTADGKIYHVGHVEKGTLHINDKGILKVDSRRRAAIARNHSATHLLHKALTQVLGDHVHQAGSLVNEGHLRFDFSHYTALSAEEISSVEAKVNEQILENLPVTVREVTLQEAQARGAVALFGEKYGEKVRVIKMGDFSQELCGGTHVRSTSEIGLFKILSESSIGAGLRRIEAVTGNNLLKYYNSLTETVESAANMLKTNPGELTQKIDEILDKINSQEREIRELRLREIRYETEGLIKGIYHLDGINVVASKVSAGDMGELRTFSDILKQKIASGIFVLGASDDEKVYLAAYVSPDMIKKGFHAGNIVKETAKIVDGSGGGRPDFAQAGGKRPDKLDEAIKAVYNLLKK